MSRLDILPDRSTDIELKDIVKKEGEVETSIVLGVILDPYEQKWKIRTDKDAGYEEEYEFVKRPSSEEKLEPGV